MDRWKAEKAAAPLRAHEQDVNEARTHSPHDFSHRLAGLLATANGPPPVSSDAFASIIGNHHESIQRLVSVSQKLLNS